MSKASWLFQDFSQLAAHRRLVVGFNYQTISHEGCNAKTPCLCAAKFFLAGRLFLLNAMLFLVVNG